MRVLVTGSAGFIGFSLVMELAKKGVEVYGLDNINDYYDINLKYARLAESGIDREQVRWNELVKSNKFCNYSFIRLNLQDRNELMEFFKQGQFDVVVNLAAQAGVRYSITNPYEYIESNICGFLNILEACRHNQIKHLVYASSSSVYGLNEQMPFSISQPVNHPVSLYAATKKSNELMAHVYSYLYKIPTTGLRFFTVYGPWGRPDMASYLFADAIINGKPIKVFNQGKMKRDFTFIDDVVKGIINVIVKPAAPIKWDGKNPDPAGSVAPYRIYNLGNNQPVELFAFIKEIERNCNRAAILEMMENQPGDVVATWADVTETADTFKFKPNTTIQVGIRRFISWYKWYHQIELTTKRQKLLATLRVANHAAL